MAVDIISDLALRATFDDAELQKERGVILEEIAMVEDTPEDLVGDVLSEAQFEGSLMRPILGTTEQIRAYTRADLVGYWHKHYRPQNMVAIAGNYDWDAFLTLIREYFTAFPETDVAAAQDEPQQIISGRKARERIPSRCRSRFG